MDAGGNTMIYTVTFNPSLDYIVSVEDFRLGLTNRTSTEKLLPGGKGINVSIVLGNLGIESTALGFIAGFTGDEVARRLQEMGVRNGLIRIEEGFTRINLKLKNIDGTEINGQGPHISAGKQQLLMDQLEELKEGDVLFLSGSIPKSMPDDTYQKIMELLDGRGVLIAVDATRDLLTKVLPYHPFLIKPNNHELGEIFGRELTTRESVVPYAKQLKERGAQNVLVSMAGEGAVLVAADGTVYEAPAPKGTLLNGVGAGDSMVAGFMAGWMEKHSYEHAFRMGVAAGSASAFSENLATKEEILGVYQQVKEQRR
jgi:1-phosphofructokinase